MLTDPRSAPALVDPPDGPDAARPESAPDVEDGSETTPATVRRAGLLELVLVLTVAIEVGVACNDFVLEPLLDGVGGPRAQARAVLLVVAIVVAVCWPGRLTDDPEFGDDRRPKTPVELDDRARLAPVLASLAPALAAPAVSVAPLTVHVAAHLVEVFWDGPPPPPARPWVAAPSGWVWEVSPPDLDPRPPRGRSPLPALVELGTTPTGALWLNLAAFRVVTVAGDTGDLAAAFDAILDQLRRADAAGVLELLVMPSPAPSGTVAAGDLGPLERILGAMWQHRAAARRRDGRRARRGRGTAPGPLVVAVGPGTPAGAVGSVLDAARGDRGILCLVTGVHPGADLCLLLDAHQVRVPFLGPVPVRPAWDREHEPDRPPPVEPVPTGPEPTADPAPRGPVTIRLLGRVAVDGAPGVLHAKSIELVAYLACHRDGVRDDQIRAALWPDRAPSPKTWANRVSVTRRALGCEPGGEPLLRHLRTHIGRLAPAVRCDLDQLADALTSAGAAGAADEPAAARGLEAALTLVRGRPFDVNAGYEWAFTELHVAHAERTVVDAAHHLSEVALARHDPQLARWSAEQGLRACPTSETLHQDRMRAYAAAGDRPGLDASRRDLLHALDAEDPTTALEPDTVELYEQLRARLIRSAAATPSFAQLER